MTDRETIEVWPSRREMHINVDHENGCIYLVSGGDEMYDEGGIVPVDVGNLRDLIVVLDDLARKLGV